LQAKSHRLPADRTRCPLECLPIGLQTGCGKASPPGHNEALRSKRPARGSMAGATNSKTAALVRKRAVAAADEECAGRRTTATPARDRVSSGCKAAKEDIDGSRGTRTT